MKRLILCVKSLKSDCIDIIAHVTICDAIYKNENNMYVFSIVSIFMEIAIFHMFWMYVLYNMFLLIVPKHMFYI